MSAITWVVQLLLVAVFALGGFMDSDGRARTGPAAVAPGIFRRGSCASSVSPDRRRVGLVLPAATGIRPRLTTIAALGLALIMVLAMAFHALRQEFQALPINVVLGSLAAFVGWSRSTRVSTASNIGRRPPVAPGFRDPIPHAIVVPIDPRRMMREPDIVVREAVAHDREFVLRTAGRLAAFEPPPGARPAKSSRPKHGASRSFSATGNQEPPCSSPSSTRHVRVSLSSRHYRTTLLASRTGTSA